MFDFIFELFLALSNFGHTVNSSSGALGDVYVSVPSNLYVDSISYYHRLSSYFLYPPILVQSPSLIHFFGFISEKLR
jgi:hypothetical protein